MTAPVHLLTTAYGYTKLCYEEVMNLVELRRQVPTVGGCHELLWQDDYRDGNWKKLL